MKRHLIPSLVLLTVAVIAYFAIFYDDAATPLPSPAGVVEGQGGAGAEIVPVETGGAIADIDAGSRRAVTPSRGPLYDDPEIQAALCGFKGRVVNHLKVPVPEELLMTISERKQDRLYAIEPDWDIGRAWWRERRWHASEPERRTQPSEFRACTA